MYIECERLDLDLPTATGFGGDPQSGLEVPYTQAGAQAIAMDGRAVVIEQVSHS
jgi:hypothetical protein